MAASLTLTAMSLPPPTDEEVDGQHDEDDGEEDCPHPWGADGFHRWDSNSVALHDVAAWGAGHGPCPAMARVRLKNGTFAIAAKVLLVASADDHPERRAERDPPVVTTLRFKSYSPWDRGENMFSTDLVNYRVKGFSRFSERADLDHRFAPEARA